MATLRPIGRTYSADENGRLPRIGRAPTPPWDAVCAEAVGQLLSDDTEGVVSVALRGSVSRGTAVRGTSDIDLVVVTDGASVIPDDLTLTTHRDIYVEVDAIDRTALVAGHPRAWPRFSLAFGGWTLWGEDIVATLPDPVLDHCAIAHLKGLNGWTKAWPDHYARATSDDDRRAVCVWLAKRCVRSAFEGVMRRERVYSRDLYPCAEVAARCHPRYGAALFTAAELAVQPTADQARMAAMLDAVLPLLRSLREGP